MIKTNKAPSIYVVPYYSFIPVILNIWIYDTMLLFIFICLLSMQTGSGGHQSGLHNITTQSFVVKSLDVCYRRRVTASNSTASVNILTHTDVIHWMKYSLQCVHQLWQHCSNKQEDSVQGKTRPCYFTSINTHLMKDTFLSFQTFSQFRVNLTFLEFRLQSAFYGCHWHEIWVNIRL